MFKKTENVVKPIETEKADKPSVPKEFQGFQGSKEFQGFQEIKENVDSTDENNVTETLVESENDDKPIETAKTDELIGFKIHKRIHSDEKLTPQSPKSPYMKAMANYRDKLADLISPITNESELKKPMIPESSNQKVRKLKKSDNSEFLSDTTSYTDVSTKKEKIVQTEESKRKCEVCKHIFYDASSLRKHKKRKRCKQLISPIKKPKMQEENENFDKAYESFESESADENNVIGTFDQSEYEKRRVIY